MRKFFIRFSNKQLAVRKNMKKIKFTLDSTCDLSSEMIDEMNLGIMPLIVTLGEENYLDGVDVFPDDIFSYVSRTSHLPKTAARSPEDYKEFFVGFLNQGYDCVVHFNISSEISASNQNAMVAAQDIKNVYVINSLQLSTGTALLMLLADRLHKEGKDVKEIVQECEKQKNNVQTSFVIEKLDYLYKGGRCSGLQRLGANLLKLRPCIKMREGQLFVGGKYKGNMKVALEKYIRDLQELYPNYDDNTVFITHSDCPCDVVENVKKHVQELFDFKNIYITRAGSTITSHCGKGTLGVLFLNNK